MKNLYALLLCILLPVLLSAQQKGDKWFTIGLSQQAVSLERYYNPFFYGPGGLLLAHNRTNSPWLLSPGVQLGFGWKVKPRLEVSLRANYTAASGIDNWGVAPPDLMQGEFSPDPEGSLASHKSLWVEGIVYKNLFRRYTRLNVQLGFGLSCIRYWQVYRSSYIFNRIMLETTDTIIDEVAYVLGFPLQLQLKYPLSPSIHLGAQLGGNVFLDTSVQAGFTVFGAYRLNR